jgi:hypothetical protein
MADEIDLTDDDRLQLVQIGDCHPRSLHDDELRNRASRTRLWQAGLVERDGPRNRLTHAGLLAYDRALVALVMAGTAPAKGEA